MKIFAGPRGSGKSYNLAHAAIEDEWGIFVAQTPEMCDWTVQEYPELAGRITSREQVGVVDTTARLYIDDTKNGDDLSWATKWAIGGIAVAMTEGRAVPAELSETYVDALKEKYSQE